MKEVVRRRYTRLIEEGSPCPTSSSPTVEKDKWRSFVKLSRTNFICVFPLPDLPKDRRHRTSELLYGFPPLTIGIKQRHTVISSSREYTRRSAPIRHHFHRDKRSKSQVASALDSIPGIGEKRKAALLKTFKSVARIKNATLEEIAAVVGEAAAKNIKESLTE